MNDVDPDELREILAPARSQLLGPAPQAARSACEAAVVVHDGQCPAPAGQLPGDRGVGHHRPFVAGVEGPPLRVQPPIALRCMGGDRRRGASPASLQVGRGTVGGAVLPGRLNQQPADMAVAGLGHPQLGPAASGGMLLAALTRLTAAPAAAPG
jgi:hypothetical protein